MRRRLECCAEAWQRGEFEELNTYPLSRVRRPLPIAVGLCAAATCALLTLLGWTRSETGRGSAATLAERLARARLLRSSPRVGRWPWASVGGSAVSGDVVWDNDRQQGFLRLEGLPPNAGAAQQYHLWIFDAARGEHDPLYGGVFEAGTAGAVVVPIRTPLRVGRAVGFAVTLEEAGGTVVSKRRRVVARTGADAG